MRISGVPAGNPPGFHGFSPVFPRGNDGFQPRTTTSWIARPRSPQDVVVRASSKGRKERARSRVAGCPDSGLLGALAGRSGEGPGIRPRAASCSRPARRGVARIARRFIAPGLLRGLLIPALAGLLVRWAAVRLARALSRHDVHSRARRSGSPRIRRMVEAPAEMPAHDACRPECGMWAGRQRPPPPEGGLREARSGEALRALREGRAEARQPHSL